MTSVSSTAQDRDVCASQPLIDPETNPLEGDVQTEKEASKPKAGKGSSANLAKDTISSADPSKEAKGSSSWLPSWSSSWTFSLPSWSSSQSKAPIKAEKSPSLDGNEYEVYKQLSVQLADLEYEVMRLEAHKSAYKHAGLWHLENRSFFQELGLLRPDLTKVEQRLEKACVRLEALQKELDSEKKRLKAYFAYEGKLYEYQAIKKGVNQAVEKGDLDSSELLDFLRKSQDKQRALKQELDDLKKELEGLKAPVKA